jgi:hypothetical protein
MGNRGPVTLFADRTVGPHVRERGRGVRTALRQFFTGVIMKRECIEGRWRRSDERGGGEEPQVEP